MIVAWIATWLLASQLVADAAARMLEWPEVDPVAEARTHGSDKLALVVLGAGVKTDAPRVPAGETLNQGGAARILGAARLYREIGPRLVVLSGGNGPVEAAAHARRRDPRGHPARDRVVTEPRSANTHENAIEEASRSARRAHLDTIVLVDELSPYEEVHARLFGAPSVFASIAGAGRLRQHPMRDHNSRSWLPSSAGLLKCAQVAHELYGLAGTLIVR